MKMASRETGLDVRKRLMEITHLSGILNLPQFLEIEAEASYDEWKSAAKAIEIKYKNTKFKYSNSGVQLCQKLKTEFKDDDRWEGLLNRLAQLETETMIKTLQLSKPPTSDINAARRTIIGQVKFMGVPDPETFVDYLFSEAGLEIDEDDEDKSDELDVQLKALHKQQEQEAKAELIRKMNAEREIQAKAKAKLEQAEREAAAWIALDDAQWAKVRSSQTQDALLSYIRQFPSGRHIEEAQKLLYQIKLQNAEIKAGRWKLTPQMATELLALYGGSASSIFTLNKSGEAYGETGFGALGFNSKTVFNGRWQYDVDQKHLSMYGKQQVQNIDMGGDFISRLVSQSMAMPPAQPVQYNLILIEGGGGRFRARDEQDNLWMIEKA